MNQRSRTERRLLRQRRRPTTWGAFISMTFPHGLTAKVCRYRIDGVDRATYQMPGITVRGSYPPNAWVVRELTVYAHPHCPR